MELYLVRHAQSLGNVGITGDREPDPKLTPQGITQAEYLADYLSDVSFDRIYASHLSRAIHTAAIVAKKQKSPPPVIAIPEFAERGTPAGYEADVEYHREICPGVIYAGTSIGRDYPGDMERTEPALWKYVFSPAYLEATETVLKKGEEIRSNPEKVLLVAHGALNAVILSRLVNFRFDANMNIVQHNTCINRFRFFLHNGAQRTAFLSYNEVNHLPPELRPPV